MNRYDLPPRRYSYDEIANWPDEARRELHDGVPITLYAPEFGRTLAYMRAIGNVLIWLNEVNQADYRGDEVFSCALFPGAHWTLATIFEEGAP